MKQRTKFGRRAFSILLSSLMLLSSMFSLAVDAASGQSAGSVSWSSACRGNAAWYTYSPDYEFVMSIRASSITDDTAPSAMNDLKVRYGNGNSADMRMYPLFMQMNIEHMSNNAFNSADYKEDVNNNVEASRGKDKTKLYKAMKKELDKVDDYADWRKNHSSEFTGYDEDTTTGNKDGIRTYKGKAISSNNNNKRRVYLEDILGYAMSDYINEKISYYDLRNFWYFYTRFAHAANKDWGFKNNKRIGLGEALNNAFIDGSSAVQDSAKRMKMIQSGYMVALFCSYGSDPYKLMSDRTSFTQSDSALNYTLWSPDSTNKYKSFVVDKLVTNLIKSNNNYINVSTLVSMTDYAHMIKIAGGMGNRDFMKEYASLTFIPYSDYGCMSDCGVSSIWHSALHTIARHLFPTRSNGKECKVNGKKTYAGWGYYEVTDGSVDHPESINRFYEGQKQVATEVTYNAYLATSNNDDKWEDEISDVFNPKGIDAFANNGHVMTDTVYISEPRTYESVANSFADYPQLVDNHSYMTTTVDPSIKLSAPVNTTTYGLKNLSYRITGASGMTGEAGKAEYVKPTGTTQNSIGIKGSDLNSAFNDADASYKVRKHLPEEDASIKAGYGTKTNDPTKYFYYYVYTYNDNTDTYDHVTTSDNKWYTTGGYVNSNKNNYVSASSPSASSPLTITSNPGKFTKSYEDHETDVDKKSTNFYYIKFPSGGIIPAVYENGKWWLCPVIEITNLLVQIKADYTANFGKGSQNYNNTYQSQEIPEYLLTINHNTNDFVKSGKQLNTLIDNYSTNKWGSLVHTDYSFQPNSGDEYGNIALHEENSYQYWLSSLRNKKGQAWGIKNSNVQEYLNENIGLEDVWHRDWYETDKSNKISNARKKVQFLSKLEFTSPTFVGGTKIIAHYDGNDAITTPNNTFLNSNLFVKVRRFTKFTENGQGASTLDSALEHFNKLSFTSLDSNNNISLSLINNIAGIYTPAQRLSGQFKPDEYKDNANASNPISKYYSDGTLSSLSDTNYNMTLLYFKKNRTENSFTPSDDAVKGYTQAYFPKVLAAYAKCIFTKRGVVSGAKTPYVAKWKYSDNSLNDQVSNGHVITQGILNKYKVSASTVGKVLDTANSDFYTGFCRFGQTTISLPNSNNESKYFLKRTLNNIGKPASLTNVTTDSNVTASVMKGWMFSSAELTFAEPFTQSSFDVPLVYTVNVRNGAFKGAQKIDTKFTSDVSNPNTVKATYQYSDSTYGNNIYPTSNSSGNNTAGIFKYKNSSGTYEDKVSLGLYPEVLMWAESDITNSSSTPSHPSYSHIITVGARERYIPAMTYTKVEFKDGSITARVTGTAVAFDTRAKALATRLGSASANTQVLYSGSALKIAYTANGVGKVKSYVLDFNGSINSETKETWGNKNYSAKNAASAAMHNITNQFTSSISKQLGIYNGTSFKTINMGTSDSDALSVSDPTYTGYYYNLTIRNGQVTKVNARKRLSDGSTDLGTFKIAYVDSDRREYEQKAIRKITMVTDSVNKPTVTFGSTTIVANCTDEQESRIKKIREILDGMQLSGSNSVLNACFDNGANSKGSGETLDMYDSFSTWSGNNNPEYNNRYSNRSGSTEGSPSYFEDTTILQIKEYTANITKGCNSTATEQLPLTLGPQTQADKNKYFSDGYKGFVMASLEIKGKSTAPTSIRDKVVAKASTKHVDKTNSSTTYDLTSGTQAQKNSWASNAIPDFIIADVTINEATTY